MNDAPRYATLRDYLRVIRRQRWLIVAVTLVFAGTAFALSITKTKSYEAQASLSFRDVGQDLNLLGTNAALQSSPAQLAAASAQLINRPAIAERARKRLGTGLSVGEIQGSISAQVGGVSNLVQVRARSSDPAFAARLANAVAVEASRVARSIEIRRLDGAIKGLRSKAGQIGTGQPDTFDEAVLREQIAQLETVKRIASPVEVAERAQVPSTPVSPRPVRNTFLGALLGLAVGLVAAFAGDSLDRRLRGAQDVHEELGLPVVGRVSDSALGFVLSPNGKRSLEDADLEAFRVLRTNLEFLRADRPIRSVVVTSGLPEEGKSTVALGLAGAAVLAGRRTLLAECDLRRPTLAERVGLASSPGMSDYLGGRAESQEVLQTLNVLEALATNGDQADVSVPSTPDLVCITAGSPVTHSAELLGSDRFRDFLAGVSEAYEMVVIDTSPVLSVVDALELIPHADAVIVCVRLSQTTRDQAKAARGALDHVPTGSMGAVVTGIRPGEDDTYEYYYAYRA